MNSMDPKTPIWKLTVEEFLEIAKVLNAEKKYEYIVEVKSQYLAHAAAIFAVSAQAVV